MPKKSNSSTQEQLLAENENLQVLLDEAVETLRTIRSSEVDALIVPGVDGERVYTLKGADYPYRVLIEQMGEGALTLAMDGVILYANQSMAEMLKVPLEKVIGSSIQAWITPDSQPILLSLLDKDNHNNQREQLDFTASDGLWVPVSISVSKMFENEIPVSFCLVATDLTEQKRSDEIKASEKLARELLAASNQSRLALLSMVEDQKRAREEIQNRNEELAALYQLSRILADADNLEEVITLVTHHAMESIRTTFTSIALLENDNLVVRGIYPVRDLEHGNLDINPQPIDALPNVKGALEKNEPVILQASNPEINSSERTFLQLDIVQSTCLVPLWIGSSLQVKDRALGLLILGKSQGNEHAPFTPEKIRLARSIGDQTASAIRRTQAKEQASHRLQRITALREIDNAIATSFDIRLSLEVILKHVVEKLKVDAVAVLVINTSLQTLEYKAGRGFRSEAIKNMQQKLMEGQVSKAILEKRMVQIQDVATQKNLFAKSDLIKAEQVSSYIAVPLIIKGKVNGVMEIFNRSPLEHDEEWCDFLNTLAGQAAIAIDNDQLFYSLQRSNIELGLAYDATIEGWSHALDLRDKETEGHSIRVTELTVKMAQSFGISNNKLKQVRWGALLHDIGKMGVPDAILLKPSPLTDEEWVVMKNHPTFAYEMLSPIQYLNAALDIPYCHHEKWDGTGYPRGLKDEQIPLAARIFAIVDVWDALLSARPYRKAWTEEKALAYILEQSGLHFDPQVVDAFMHMNVIAKLKP